MIRSLSTWQIRMGLNMSHAALLEGSGGGFSISGRHIYQSRRLSLRSAVVPFAARFRILNGKLLMAVVGREQSKNRPVADAIATKKSHGEE
jgi:hypothetical protein